MPCSAGERGEWRDEMMHGGFSVCLVLLGWYVWFSTGMREVMIEMRVSPYPRGNSKRFEVIYEEKKAMKKGKDEEFQLHCKDRAAGRLRQGGRMRECLDCRMRQLAQWHSIHYFRRENSRINPPLPLVANGIVDNKCQLFPSCPVSPVPSC